MMMEADISPLNSALPGSGRRPDSDNQLKVLIAVRRVR